LIVKQLPSKAQVVSHRLTSLAMALLPILHDPDPRLRIKALPVTVFDAALERLVEDLFETMYAAPGVGLAATQVGIAQRIAVMDCGNEDTGPQKIVMVNPEVLDSADKEEMEEGCLSVPDYRDKVQRFRRLRLKALDARGKPFEIEAEGLLAQAIQHEIDHLDGKLYIDYLSALKRERYKKKREKNAKRAA
jgi:peptide deformylase